MEKDLAMNNRTRFLAGLLSLLLLFTSLPVMAAAGETGTFIPTKKAKDGALVGDVNKDNAVDATDRMLLARFLAGWEGYEERILSMDAADIDRDGEVNAKDRMLLARFLAGWEGYEEYFTRNGGDDIPDNNSKAIDESHIAIGSYEYEGEMYDDVHYIDNEVIVVAADNITKTQIAELAASYKASIVGAIEMIGTYLLEFDSVKTMGELQQIIQSLLSDSNVEDAYINTVSEVSTDIEMHKPDDNWGGSGKWDAEPTSGNNWGLKAIRVPMAWQLLIDKYDKDNLSRIGDYSKIPSVSIGVIDSLFDIDHDDLIIHCTHIEGNLKNAGSREQAAKVDDKDTYELIYAHGTHVAGTIAAITNDKRGVSGISLNNELYGYSLATGHSGINKFSAMLFNLQDAVSTLLEKSSGKMVINFSMETGTFGFGAFESAKMAGTLKKYINKGYDFIICAAAGNGKLKEEGAKEKDAAKNSIFNAIDDSEIRSRIIVVTGTEIATVENDSPGVHEEIRLTDGYNYGSRIDVSAPGSYIWSTVPPSEKFSNNQDVWYMGGTSMATPHVSGVAALVWAADPSLSGAEVKDIILQTATIQVPGKDKKELSHNMVDAYAAVELAIKEYYTVHFDANTGGGAMEDQSIEVVITGDFIFPECGFTPPDSCVFKCWRFNDKDYAPGDTMTVNGGGSGTAYAVWTSIPEDAVEYNGHYYRLYTKDNASSYEESLVFCKEKGGYLATLTTQEENNFIYQYMLEQGYQNAYFGLSDAEQEGVWKWCTGEPLTYTFWSRGEPNGQNPREDYALFYYKNTDGSWNDGDFGAPSEFICEWGDYGVTVGGSEDPILLCSVMKPTGGGSKDLNVICDGVKPEATNATDLMQYDTYHGGSGPEEAYVGFLYNTPRTVREITFTEGNHFWDGGWFRDGAPQVEVWKDGGWVLCDCDITPDYPVSNNRELFGDGYDTYVFRLLEPVQCWGVRLIGTAGGEHGFISISELEVQ